MSPVAEQARNWVPPWRTRARATGSLVLVWTVPALLRLDLSLASAADLRWLRTWLEQYLTHQPEGSSEEVDYTFFYVLIGEVGAVAPEGRVDGKAVLEAGFGGPPAGPEDASTTSVDELVRFAIDCLPT
jgi:hypothetical protein